MKFVLQPPADQEIAEIAVDPEAKNIEFTPALVRGTHIIKVAYLTARGEGGVESKAVVLFNGRTGAYSIQQLGEAPPVLDFDLPQSKFDEKREKARMSGTKGQQLRKKGDAPSPPPAVSQQGD